MRRIILGGIVTALLTPCSSVWASAESNGSAGINSSGLTIERGLTGDRIDIGQVEIRRTGDPEVGKDEAGTIINSTVDPEEVFYRQVGGSFAPTYNLGNEVENHAIEVAGVMISTDAIAQGVAQDADLFSIGINPTAGTLEGTYEQVAESVNHLATLAGQDSSGQNIDIKAINLSLGVTQNPGDADGTSTFTSYLDWSAHEHDVLYVVGGSELTTPFGVPDDNYNGMTVVYSAKNGAKFRQVGTGNILTADDSFNRTFPDIMAPGEEILLASGNNTTATESGTSFAAPHVTGTVALLQEHAVNESWGDNAKRHEVMKAVIMNSADKIEEGSIHTHNDIVVPPGGLLGMERTAIDRHGDDWFDSEAYDDNATQGGFIPLDDEMGVGHLNASRAFTQFSAGEFDESTTVDVPVIGWDYGTTTGASDINRYRFDEPLRGGSFVAITLAFDRIVDFDNDADSDGEYDAEDTFVDYKDTDSPGDPPGDSQINDLDLYFLPRGSFSDGQALAQSVSLDSTVDHIFFPSAGRRGV